MRRLSTLAMNGLAPRILCCFLLLLCTPSQGHTKKKAAPAAPAKQAAPTEVPSASGDELHEVDERVFGDYLFRLTHVLDDRGSRGWLDVFQNGRKVHTLSGHRLAFGHVYSDEPGLDNEIIAVGKDVTGDGIPNLVVSEWTGEARCCFKFHIYELGRIFREVAVIDAGHGDFSHFANLDGGGSLEFVTADWTFWSWRTGSAESPAPQVILSYSDGAYVLNKNLMRKLRPAQETFQAEARKVRSDPAWSRKEQPPALWDYMLRLIYGGNGALAREFLDKAWPMGIPGKEEFYQDFRGTLARSPYYQALLDLNGGPFD